MDPRPIGSLWSYEDTPRLMGARIPFPTSKSCPWDRGPTLEQGRSRLNCRVPGRSGKGHSNGLEGERKPWDWGGAEKNMEGLGWRTDGEQRESGRG